MSDERFPYNLPSRAALIRLINEDFPNYGLTDENAEFGIPFFSPTEQHPGRTYIEAFNTLTNAKMWFVYRRLDLARALINHTTVHIEGIITPRKIVEELNRSYEMTFGDTDVNMSNIQLVPNGESTVYRLRALSGSLVWYGETLIQAYPYNNLTGVRLMEDATGRLMENGNFRLLEDATRWLDIA